MHIKKIQISKEKIIQLIIVAILMLSFGCQENKSVQKREAATNVANTKPNLLFIFADQYRRQAMGFLNEDPVITPNIDHLAKEGIYFSKAVANHPLCSPYRGMLVTGQYPLTNGVIANCHSGRTKFNNYLDKRTETFSDVVAKNGYNAGYIGKWHLEGPKPTAPGETTVWDAWCPQDRRHGYDFWYAYNADNHHFKPHYWATNAEENEAVYVNKWSPEHEANVIMEYLEGAGHAPRDANKPFALFWSINPPHNPYREVPEKYREHYKGKSHKDLLKRPNARFTDNNTLKAGDRGVEEKISEAPDYFACVTGVDDQIGRVIAKLKALGIYDNTIIVFSSDHGEMLGSQGLMHKNIWFRESYEIPFIVHWPKKIAPKTEDLLISVPDYMPTLLGLMGLEKEIPDSVEGVNYSPILLGQEMQRPDSQLYFGSEPSNPSLGRRGFRDMQHTFAVVKDNKDGSKTYYLYDDKNDPYQLENIWGRDKEVDDQVMTKLTSLLTKMNDPWIKN
ncbi:sulfatase [Tamlana sp. 2201CG12-4]|uniref:sulfatase family protein n=1 Tax=Tamlana sp. 2201CG12-4 TaxID=3112582 RepID=UPI002DBA0F67|nr:sulfatase [Tamlana sp. 2201CG12-4]MEC3908803.1 sulfatase [Tamlana sp. 2201CG12-4]